MKIYYDDNIQASKHKYDPDRGLAKAVTIIFAILTLLVILGSYFG